MNYSEIVEQIALKGSFLCVGLDSDNAKLPICLKERRPWESLYNFTQKIVDATAPYAVAFKPNVAFYESLGKWGWEVLSCVVEHIKRHYPEILVIADAKRGDIGNTSLKYAHTFFEELDADAVTVAPYMGKDSVQPFLDYEDKWTVILGLTSNAGSEDFQMAELADGQKLYQKVIATAASWGSVDNTMFVVGATKAEMLKDIRKIVREHFLLVPGVGAQGGSLEKVAQYGMNQSCGLLVNASRSIIYASSGNDFAQAAALKAQEMQQQMRALLIKHSCIYE